MKEFWASQQFLGQILASITHITDYIMQQIKVFTGADELLLVHCCGCE